MAKRFTDTDKWKKPLLRSLETPYKLLWLYILDDCDHAGIWDVSNLDIDSILIGEQLTLDGVKEAFGDNAYLIGTKLFMPNFIKYQYGELCDNNRVHISVIKRLKELSININTLAPSKGLTSTKLGCKDKDKDKDKDKFKDKSFQSPNYTEFEAYLIQAMPLVNPEWTPDRVSRASRLQYETYEENGWKDGNGKQVKNWKTKAKTALSFKKPWNYGNEDKPKSTGSNYVNTLSDTSKFVTRL